MEEPQFGVGSCGVPGDTGEERTPVLSREALIEALRESRIPEERGVPVTFPVSKRLVSFETPGVIAARSAGFPILTPELEAWIPGAMELALLVRGHTSEAALHLGGHVVAGTLVEPPSPPYAPGPVGFRFSLSPQEAAALLLTAPLLALDGRAPVPVPGVVAEELRAHLPASLDVPLTLVEF